ncbi:MAG TPA: hypothetical protein VN618_01660 [Solirubrobacteraceae bacterium]|nr:hypothetical protein [Solirubrobacteraceae bacterium]
MKTIRRHVSYANVVATLALVFAMSGSAIAAKHYLLSSTRQISPSLLKKLRGRTGKPGPRGTTGAQGPAGAKGETGSPAPSVLTSGRSESGVYALTDSNTKAGAEASVGVTFPIPLPERLPEGKYRYLPPGNTSPECSGPGHSAPGFLCVYSTETFELDFENIFNPEKSGVFGSGVFGFEIAFATKGTAVFDLGTWTVTAP